MDKRTGKNEAQRLPPSLYSWNCYESVTAHSSDFSREGGREEETHRNAIQQTRTVRRPPEGYGGTSLVYYCVCNSFTSTPLPQKLGMHLPDKSSSIFVQEIDSVDALLSFNSDREVVTNWSRRLSEGEGALRDTQERRDVSLLTHQFPNNHSGALY